MSSLPVKREPDAAGLSLEERKILQEIVATASWQQAADNLGMTRRQLRYRFRNPAFKQAYDELFGAEETQAVKREMDLVASDVAGLYEEAKNAERTQKIEASCPKCNTKFSVYVTVMDWTAKLRAGETLLKMLGLLKDERRIKVEGQVGVVHMTVDEQMALLALRAGRPIPEHMVARLRSMGALEGVDLPPPRQNAVEGDFREVTEEAV